MNPALLRQAFADRNATIRAAQRASNANNAALARTQAEIREQQNRQQDRSAAPAQQTR